MIQRRADENDGIGTGTMTDMRYIGVRVSDQLYEQVKRLADTDRRSLNVYITILLERAVADAERGSRDREPPEADR
jgi:hypothetical protein